MPTRRWAAALTLLALLQNPSAAYAADGPIAVEAPSLKGAIGAATAEDPIDDRSEEAWLVRSLVGTGTVLALVLPFTWRMRQLNRRLRREALERRQTEKLLRASEERMRKLLDISPDGIVTTDIEGRITYFSPQQAELLEIPRTATVVGRPIYEWIHADERHQARDRLHRQLAGEPLQPQAYRMIKHDGGSLWGELASAVILDGRGETEGFLIIIRDINERKFLEEALQRTNDALLAQIAETNRLQDQLREQAVRDPLTGLYNRRYLAETLERELARAGRDQYTLCVAMIDIDHFKHINDSYGHQAGDEVLRTLGSLLRAGARSGDVACRWGGEEFMVVLPRVTKDTARDRTEQWRAAFAGIAFSLSGEQVGATFSVGIAVFPEHGWTADELTQNADLALYLAKAQGRDRVVVFEPG